MKTKIKPPRVKLSALRIMHQGQQSLRGRISRYHTYCKHGQRSAPCDNRGKFPIALRQRFFNPCKECSHHLHATPNISQSSSCLREAAVLIAPTLLLSKTVCCATCIDPELHTNECQESARSKCEQNRFNLELRRSSANKTAGTWNYDAQVLTKPR